MIDLLSPVWAHNTVAEIERGEGIYLYDKQGRRYIDFTSGIGVVNTGHCHPRIVRTIQEQAAKLIFGQINCVIPETTLALAEALNEVTPSEINRYFFTNSGSEATEAAVKMAKFTTGKPNIIVFQGSFHGRSHLTMAMTTSKTMYRQRYQPLPSGIFVTPFPHPYRFGWDEATTVAYCMQQLEHLVKTQTAPEETAAIIIEPILGEGGYIPAPTSFIQQLRQWCDHHNILLIIDEVQSGFGRTGSFFCFEQSGVLPDVIIMAKGMGSGMPIAGVASGEELMHKWTMGAHGGTYGGGNAIATAVACETIKVMQEENLPSNAERQGAYLRNRLLGLQQVYQGRIGEVRGRGLMIGMEFVKDGQPDGVSPKQVTKACAEKGLLLLTCGTYNQVIRWIPPLIVTQQEIDEALVVFETSLKQVLDNG
jgi:4-aminobutyrate aminotransferase